MAFSVAGSPCGDGRTAMERNGEGDSLEILPLSATQYTGKLIQGVVAHRYASDLHPTVPVGEVVDAFLVATDEVMNIGDWAVFMSDVSYK